ncbi:MAG: hypothetical protein JSR60_14330 [Proteobacteria bacterium]|nr:hypothetical protein [Pseudomonadota bacterium]
MTVKKARARRVAVEIPQAPPEMPDPGPSARDHPHSRAIAHFITEFILRCAHTISGAFQNDYEAAILFLTISNRNSEKVMSDPALRQRYGSYTATIPDEHVLLINRMALARATGLPRETVRRKVGRLVEKGWVIEQAGGLRIRPDINRDAGYIAILEPQAQNLRRLFTMLVTSGALNPGG